MKLKKVFRDVIKAIIIAFLVALIFTTITNPTLVKGKSMLPTIDENDYIMINKAAYLGNGPEYEDIIVFKSDMVDETGETRNLIKRVIGLPGDTIEITKGKIYRNEKEIKEEYINGETNGVLRITIEDDKYFVLGDNRENSLDSRSQSVGLVEKERIKGKLFLRFYPLDRMKLF